MKNITNQYRSFSDFDEEYCREYNRLKWMYLVCPCKGDTEIKWKYINGVKKYSSKDLLEKARVNSRCLEEYEKIAQHSKKVFNCDEK